MPKFKSDGGFDWDYLDALEIPNDLIVKCGKCGICNRELGDVAVDEHHLVPKAFKGKETILLHKICHRKVHATLTERELLNYYNTIERLREHEEIQKFAKWVSKKPIEYYSGSDETSVRKGKRR